MDERKAKILEIIKEKGPVLPIDIAQEIESDLLISSAILSEMVRQKELQISHIKIGSSPLYFLPEQKSALEKFIGHLEPREKKVFEMLKKKTIIDDDKISHADRVAIRDLKDFAIPIKVTQGGKSYLFWRFYLTHKEEVAEKLKALMEKAKLKIEEARVAEEKIEEIKEIKETELKAIEKPILKVKITARTLAFKEKVLDYAKNNNIMPLGEGTLENGEVTMPVAIKSEIGNLQFLVVARDKKSINDADISLAYNLGQDAKMPVLFLTNGKLNAKGKVYAESLKGQIIFKQLK